MANKVLTYHFSQPLSGATSSVVNINNGDGNLTIDGQTGSESVLANGTLEYLEKQGPPNCSVSCGEKTCLTLKAGKGEQPWIRFPWSACNGATSWQVHLNPTVQVEMTAYTSGGNVLLDLAGMKVTRVSAETGGGNMEVILPEDITRLSLAAKSGAGNVVVHIPTGMAARIQANSGLGQVIVASPYPSVDKNTFQSPDYPQAARRVEIIVSSGAGNVSIKERSVSPEPQLP
jgi:hypothetical protein